MTGTGTGTPLMRVRGLVKEFPVTSDGFFLRRKGTVRAVNGVSFDLARGETLAIVGESGSGKSTTARIAAKLIEPTSGTVELDGDDVTQAGDARLRRFRGDVQMVFQDPFSSLNPRHDVEQIVSAPLRYLGLKAPGGYRAVVKDAMARVGLDPDHSRRYPAQFSGGQAQRIGIARALVVNPKVVICDEPVSALDVSVQAQIIDLLKSLQREGGFSYIVISHDLAVVRQLAHRVAVMSSGEIVEHGPRDEIFQAPRHDYTRTLLTAIPRIRSEWDSARKGREDGDGRHGAER